MSTTDTSLKDAIEQRTHQTWLGAIVSQQTFWIVLAVVGAIVAMSLLTTTFATPNNLFNVTRNFSLVAIVGLGMTAVIISGGIDLSVGAVVLISAMVTTVIMHAGLPIWVALPAAMGASLLVGLINGLLIAVAGMPAFVVTLGMMSIARSIGMVMSNNALIYEFGPDQAILFSIGGGSLTIPGLPPIPNPVIVMLVLAAITGFALRFTRWGRHLYAIGGNERAAVLTGVPVKAIKISVYMFVALCAGITGFLMTGWLGSVTTGLGTGLELTVIAAAVIGGANLAGGSGTALGAIIGALLIEIIRNSLTLLGISTFWQGTFVGTFIILAVAVELLRNREIGD
ncbi:MAG: ABC transporter permease [Devosia sp.]